MCFTKRNTGSLKYSQRKGTENSLKTQWIWPGVHGQDPEFARVQFSARVQTWYTLLITTSAGKGDIIVERLLDPYLLSNRGKVAAGLVAPMLSAAKVILRHAPEDSCSTLRLKQHTTDLVNSLRADNGIASYLQGQLLASRTCLGLTGFAPPPLVIL